jgi:hypothetical protein
MSKAYALFWLYPEALIVGPAMCLGCGHGS